jgi:hypothetical protein
VKYLMRTVAWATIGSFVAVVPAVIMGEWEIALRFFVCALVGSGLCHAYNQVRS